MNFPNIWYHLCCEVQDVDITIFEKYQFNFGKMAMLLLASHTA